MTDVSLCDRTLCFRPPQVHCLDGAVHGARARAVQRFLEGLTLKSPPVFGGATVSRADSLTVCPAPPHAPFAFARATAEPSAQCFLVPHGPPAAVVVPQRA